MKVEDEDALKGNESSKITSQLPSMTSNVPSQSRLESFVYIFSRSFSIHFSHLSHTSISRFPSPVSLEQFPSFL